MDLAKIGADTRQIVLDVLDKAALVEGDIFVLGLSSSEVVGGHIGQILVWKSDRSLSKPYWIS